MSADFKELYRARKTAKEDLVLTTKALEAGIAERLNDAICILCECARTMHDVGLGDADFDEAIDTIQHVSAEIAGDESEVAND